MHIGLLRHFPVHEPIPSGWRTAAELQSWRKRYDMAGTSVATFDASDIVWKRCLSSDLPRALTTARAIFPGEIEQTALLREASIAAFNTGNLRRPVFLWRWMLRIAFLAGHHSQRACRDDFRSRVEEIARRLSELQEDTLVVSHAGMMAYLSAELRRRGFAGPKLRIAKHATAYIYYR
jgi:broad specificity phosphatase PhoE